MGNWYTNGCIDCPNFRRKRYDLTFPADMLSRDYCSVYGDNPDYALHRCMYDNQKLTNTTALVVESNKLNIKEERKMNNFMNGMFGKVAPGMCRLSMSGGIAVKTSGGDYKSYNLKTGRLTNCSNFVFDIGEDFFFVIPTNKVEKGDIILVSGKPRCVVGVEDNKITVINYDDSTVDTILPERHVFMGETYFYGKIISMFGKDIFKGKKGTNKILQYMMMSEMMKGNNGNGGFGNMLPFMMMNGGGMENMFAGMFDFDMDDENDATDVEDEDADDKED